jgi:hypothetical protein
MTMILNFWKKKVSNNRPENRRFFSNLHETHQTILFEVFE